MIKNALKKGEISPTLLKNFNLIGITDPSEIIEILTEIKQIDPSINAIKLIQMYQVMTYDYIVKKFGLDNYNKNPALIQFLHKKLIGSYIQLFNKHKLVLGNDYQFFDTLDNVKPDFNRLLLMEIENIHSKNKTKQSTLGTSSNPIVIDDKTPKKPLDNLKNSPEETPEKTPEKELKEDVPQSPLKVRQETHKDIMKNENETRVGKQHVSLQNLDLKLSNLGYSIDYSTDTYVKFLEFIDYNKIELKSVEDVSKFEERFEQYLTDYNVEYVKKYLSGNTNYKYDVSRRKFTNLRELLSKKYDIKFEPINSKENLEKIIHALEDKKLVLYRGDDINPKRYVALVKT